MKNQTQKRAFYVLTGCIAALALCIAAALALLCRTPAAHIRTERRSRSLNP